MVPVPRSAHHPPADRDRKDPDEDGGRHEQGSARCAAPTADATAGGEAGVGAAGREPGTRAVGTAVSVAAGREPFAVAGTADPRAATAGTGTVVADRTADARREPAAAGAGRSLRRCR
jgi:hypothetical protein